MKSRGFSQTLRLVLILALVALVAPATLTAQEPMEDKPMDTPDCTSNSDCDRSQYCAGRIGMCRGAGQCVVRPQACPLVFDPVCGCDGQTYGNTCFAAMAGTRVESLGECPPDNCRSNDDCEDGFFCNFPGRSCKGRGSCEPRPEVCIQIFDPVCGCDGETYGNACEAHAAGVSIQHPGECEDKPMKGDMKDKKKMEDKGSE